VFFITKAPLLLGSVLLLTLRVPRELSGSAKSEVHCMGRVVRMEYREDGSFGYGTRIDLRHRAAAAVRETSEMAEAAGSGSRY
jgi:ribosome maturation protein Sdo1